MAIRLCVSARQSPYPGKTSTYRGRGSADPGPGSYGNGAAASDRHNFSVCTSFQGICIYIIVCGIVKVKKALGIYRYNIEYNIITLERVQPAIIYSGRRILIFNERMHLRN